MKKLKDIPKGHTTWQLKEKDFPKIILTDVCEIHIIELPKLMKLIKNLDPYPKEKKLFQWGKFLLTPEELEVNDMKNNEAIAKIVKYTSLSKDEILKLKKSLS